MQGIIDWQLEMEQLASDTYRKAAEIFSENKEFSSFLSSLAEDEDLHFQLLEEAKKFLLKKKIHTKSTIIFDQRTKDKIKAPLQDIYEQIMAAHKVSENAIIKAIINTEFYELNEIFIYIINFLYGENKEIQNILSAVHSHINRIRDFLSKYPYEKELSDLFRRLTAIGKKKLLVVEDEMAIRTMIASLLKQFGTIEHAANGKEALDKVKNTKYDVIISDIGMPVMDGISFFQKSKEINPNISRHFVFCSGEITPDKEIFFKKHNLVYLEKPFQLNQLFEAVQSVICND